MSKKHVAAALMLGAVLAGCDQPTGPDLAAPDAGMPASTELQAAIGGRASGHVGFDTPLGGIASEHYSFTALQTAPSGFAADGAYQLHLTTVSGNNNKAQGRVICVAVIGNQARVAARVERLWIAGVPRDPNEFFATPLHNIWTVTDGGEGDGTTDTASLMFFTDAPGAALHCEVGGVSNNPQRPIDEGNVQVSAN